MSTDHEPQSLRAFLAMVESRYPEELLRITENIYLSEDGASEAVQALSNKEIVTALGDIVNAASDDQRLFEKICLEGFQSGLSWLTILRKRENFRRAFADFDIATVSRFGDAEVERLLGDAGIVRHRGKIAAIARFDITDAVDTDGVVPMLLAQWGESGGLSTVMALNVWSVSPATVCCNSG